MQDRYIDHARKARDRENGARGQEREKGPNLSSVFHVHNDEIFMNKQIKNLFWYTALRFDKLLTKRYNKQVWDVSGGGLYPYRNLDGM